MEANSIQKRLSLFATHTMDRSKQPEKPPVILQPEKELVEGKRSRAERYDFSLYQPVFDQDTQKLVGHLTDISSTGFKLDCSNPINPDRNFTFCINPSSEVTNRLRIIFVARSRWCKVDPLDVSVYNVGFQLISASPTDFEIFKRMLEMYGKKPERRN